MFIYFRYGETVIIQDAGEEVTDICIEIGIPDVNDVFVSKETIKTATRKHQNLDVRKELSDSKKFQDVKDDDFSKVQDYFHGKSVRILAWHLSFVHKWFMKFQQISKINLRRRERRD